ncbi:DEAD/DEAH box helicase [Streptomyces sp. NBC_01201]|uniref:DEAD/DEAH box helicase n=1 Tax=Streptomyces sp. NBC_01201 TaxID=2903770 RepID=UPI002E102DDD|nr:DEAD/DEAH box helicase [Streptomyces sp. NBC_01201]
MPNAFTPRPYQTTAIQALTAGWAGPNNRLAIVLPTGAGKTVVFANLIAQMRHQLGRKRALVIAHREELIEQAAAKIRAVCPDLKVGIVKAERNHHRFMDVVVASVQTLAVERRREAIQDIGMVIVDECHHAAASTYRTVLEHFGAWSGTPVAGFTATMTRGDGGLGEVWQDVVYTLDILEMIGDGYLCDVRGKRVTVAGLDLDQVKTRGGDLQDGQLGQALDDSGAAATIAAAYTEHAADRPGVVFTPTVATAQSMAAAFTDAGISASAIWGNMPRDQRARELARYKSGAVQVLTNCMVLTEGFDAPWTSCVVIARPTKSPGLYCQMVGRGLRLHDGKRDALVLDVMGASTRHKLASIVDLTAQDVGEIPEDRPLREVVEERQAAAEARRLAVHQLQFEEMDLFGRSSTLWLRTDAGTWFMPLRQDMFLFLVRDPGGRTYRVHRWDATEGVRPPHPDPSLPLASAMQWAERAGRALVPAAFVARHAAWRAKPPTPRQLGYCRSRGIEVPRGATTGEVGDLQSIHRVTAVLASLAAAEPAAA